MDNNFPSPYSQKLFQLKFSIRILPMKKFAFCLSTLVATAATSLFAQTPSAGGSSTQTQQGQTMNQPSACSQLTTEEQNFAAQVMDMNNKSMFCSQFTAQQRQQAMQMMGQPDPTGKMMTADQAVQQVMGSTGTSPAGTQAKPRTGGGCPVK